MLRLISSLFSYFQVNILGETCIVPNITCLACKPGYILYKPDMSININCDWTDMQKLSEGGCSVYGYCARKFCDGQMRMDLVCKKVFDYI